MNLGGYAPQQHAAYGGGGGGYRVSQPSWPNPLMPQQQQEQMSLSRPNATTAATTTMTSPSTEATIWKTTKRVMVCTGVVVLIGFITVAAYRIGRKSLTPAAGYVNIVYPKRVLAADHKTLKLEYDVKSVPISSNDANEQGVVHATLRVGSSFLEQDVSVLMDDTASSVPPQEPVHKSSSSQPQIASVTNENDIVHEEEGCRLVDPSPSSHHAGDRGVAVIEPHSPPASGEPGEHV